MPVLLNVRVCLKQRHQEGHKGTGPLREVVCGCLPFRLAGLELGVQLHGHTRRISLKEGINVSEKAVCRGKGEVKRKEELRITESDVHTKDDTHLRAPEPVGIPFCISAKESLDEADGKSFITQETRQLLGARELDTEVETGLYCK